MNCHYIKNVMLLGYFFIRKCTHGLSGNLGQHLRLCLKKRLPKFISKSTCIRNAPGQPSLLAPQVHTLTEIRLLMPPRTKMAKMPNLNFQNLSNNKVSSVKLAWSTSFIQTDIHPQCGSTQLAQYLNIQLMLVLTSNIHQIIRK